MRFGGKAPPADCSQTLPHAREAEHLTGDHVRIDEHRFRSPRHSEERAERCGPPSELGAVEERECFS